jgi:hypothetical protein
MIFLGLYRSVTSLTGHPAAQVPQEKHFFIFSPPGSEAMKNLKLGSSVLESIIEFQIPITNTNALSEMLKRAQHDKKKCVIPNLFRNLDFGNDNKSIAFVLDRKFQIISDHQNPVSMFLEMGDGSLVI